MKKKERFLINEEGGKIEIKAYSVLSCGMSLVSAYAMCNALFIHDKNYYSNMRKDLYWTYSIKRTLNRKSTLELIIRIYQTRLFTVIGIWSYLFPFPGQHDMANDQCIFNAQSI